MSSDEGEPSSPVLPRDSDRGSSVSSELQDEYEELLRYAVVTPKFEPHATSQLQLLCASHLSAGRPSSRANDDARSYRSAGSASEVEDGRHSREVRSARASPLVTEPCTHPPASQGEEMAGRSSAASDAPSDRQQTPSEMSRHSSPAPLVTVVTDLFISEENMGKMENILDSWGDNLKANVLTELRKWKVAFVERHKLELRKERETHAAQVAGLNAEMDSMRELLRTYETSNQRKDEVIVNLSQAVDRQRERLELMRTFTHWRLQHSEARDEVQRGRLAEQHHRLQLKRKVWAGWHSLIQAKWKERVERACRARAEEVCLSMSTEYEAKMAEHEEALEKAQAEIQRLRVERGHYEDSMKKAFMRGVCALNMEALSMFHSGDGRSLELDPHDAPPPRDDPGSGSLGHLQPRSASSHFSPINFDPPAPGYHSEAEETLGSSAPASRAEALPSTHVIHSSLPPGGSACSHKQVGTRVVTSGQQKASRTVSARITARSDLAKSMRLPGNLQVMGVAPPMSSVIVERHHPVTQLTVGQATAAKFPRSSQQGQVPSGSKSSSRTHSTCHVHSIKVVE